MYKLVAFISLMLRSQLPNPFEHTNIVWQGIPISPLLLLWFAEPILQLITYSVVGMYYNKGVDNALKGSLLYFFFYLLHICMLWIWSVFDLSTVSGIIILITYTLLHFLYNISKNKLRFAL